METSRSKVVKVSDTLTLGLQEDVLLEILSYLPVKSLLRFRCVSQEWYALTKSPYFISKHLVHRSRCSNPHHPCLLFLSRLAGSSENNFKPLLGFSLLRDEETTFLRLPFWNLTSQRRDGLWLVGSSNGLVCCVLLIGIKNDKNRTTEGEEDNATVFQQLIVVWNPATERFRFLPKPNNNITLDQDEEEDILRVKDNSLSCPLIGFDFVHDHDITEYKLVRVFHHDSDDPYDHGKVLTTFRAQVFVQITNSWRQAKNELGFPSCENSFASTSITLNGVLYWKVQRAGDECCVLSFNLREEVFNVIQLPIDLRNHDDWGGLQLYSWRNSPATVALDYSANDDLNAALWVMSTDQESKRSCKNVAQIQNPAWTRQFRFKYLVISEATRLLGSWKDQFLFASDKSDEVFDAAADNIVPQDLFSYDPKSETKRKILKDGERIKFCGGVNYVESLVPV
ncbi:putative F-box domain-containing protein [Rosa chinensis]|uniref:Putative F-box domain-containing protein n=1 Tax=Rosa chinensis TaxID=74649 RepID=A0A2P6RBG0_ROSCH|nr:F-box only protein 8 [Rosa chinensis]PRQ43759.1 putative F-box domain-containing protein [Rosa chinensis]